MCIFFDRQLADCSHRLDAPFTQSRTGIARNVCESLAELPIGCMYESESHFDGEL